MDVARTLLEAPEVEIAYPEAGPTPPPVNAADDPLSADQGYLDAAPGGIDAQWVWDNGLSDGSLVGVIDIEQGWTLNHEDLIAAGVGLVSGTNTAYHGHGTAVLGEMIGVDNSIGVIGIAPQARGRVVSQFRPNGSYSTADAIRSAVAIMESGDVLLLEAQTTYPTVSGFVPVEVEAVVFDAIMVAVSRGIIVVEAGGNGGVDLDAFRDLRGRHILNRASSDFRDSGAIIVGAGSSRAPHQRLSFSNHGSRVDCYAWGEHIQTTGDGWMGTSPTVYTTSFGGTSGASPIVTGAALLLQAWRDRQGLTRYSPQEMRLLLSDPALNTVSASPASDGIGAMPNLRAIIERERLEPEPPAAPSGVRVVT
jgi:subtilisin family serine protease